MFNRLVTDPYFQQYKPKVLSKPPDELSGFVPAVHNTKLPDNDKPWLVTLDNFLTDAECDRLIKLGHQAGYKQSHEVGGQNFDGTHGAHTSLDRTSFNAWCFEKE